MLNNYDFVSILSPKNKPVYQYIFYGNSAKNME